jgi:hypothetical protein
MYLKIYLLGKLFNITSLFTNKINQSLVAKIKVNESSYQSIVNRRYISWLDCIIVNALHDLLLRLHKLGKTVGALESKEIKDRSVKAN